MARIIYSALVESIHGSIAGTTFQRNAYGHTVKKKPNIVNPNRTNQLRSKLLLTRTIRAWTKLTDANRTTWNTYASNFPRQAKNNPSAFLSGFNYFSQVNNYRLLAGLSILPSPDFTQYEDGHTISELIVSGGDLFVGLRSSGITGTWKALIFLSRPLSGAVNYNVGKPRFIEAVDYAIDDFNVNIAYVNLYHIQPIVSDRISVRIVLVCTTNGQVANYNDGIITCTV